MASPRRPSPRQGRRLFELLEEQQEPFYENGHSERGLRSQDTTMCWSRSNACTILPRIGFKRKLRGVLRCALTRFPRWKIIRKVLHLAPENGRLSVFGCFSRMGSETRVVGFERLYCSSGLSEGASGGGIRSENREDREQLSPVSVLELHSDEGSVVCSHCKSYTNAAAVEEENPSSSSLAHPAETSEIFEELLACPYLPPLPQCAETKRKWHQTENLLLECVKEMEERILDSSQTITQLIGLNISNSRREWSHFQTEMQEIGREIEGAIFEEIREEALGDMLGSHCT